MQAQLPDGETIRGVLESILSGPEFNPPRASLAERLVRFIWEQLDRFLGWLPTPEDSTVQLLSLALVGAAAVAVVVVAWQRSGGRRSSERWRPPSRKDAGPRTPGEWARLARAAQGAGDPRAAATGLYQAVVLHLETRGALRYGEWKTPGDYADEIAGRDTAAPFESFLALFVEVAFGPSEPTDDSVESLFSRAEGLGCPT